MDGSEDTALKLMKTPVYVDSAILRLKIQIIYGPPAGYLMGSGMLLDNYAEMTRAAFRLINPLCGQSRN